ncbi:hypothetical protein NQ315_001848 [Exocentrus adspersus]|uniref:Activator 1 subunit 5 n=1 Tax=Exocentrus adspersus TaxID=1586481 RepID=A0AAV8W9I0_9CUCU|nr:hypothetical protein NQ315_001848 [Exocentrus adspersus]
MVGKAEQTSNLPWVEKYRPNTLDDLVSHEDIVRTISKFIREDQVPHLLFYGPPGTGKTSTILACARQLYTPAQFSSMVLELNASDDRGIGIVRGQILTFASTRTIFRSGFKLIILDEADAMTMDAQNALRRKPNVGKVLKTKSNNIECVILLFAQFQTSIIRRFCYDEFTRQYTPTAGADFYIKRVTLPGRKEVSVRITDVGGLELNGPMLGNYLFKSNMIVLVYDITNFASFDRLLTWMQHISKFDENPAFVAVFGNKCDLEHKRAVRLDKTQSFVEEFQLFNYLASAKTGEHVNLYLTNLIARHLGVPLSKFEREKLTTVLKAELVPSTPVSVKDSSTSVIEKYTENIRFCIICNYLSKIIPALQSRCTRFRFGPLTSEQILPRLNYVVDEEKVKITEDGRKALLTLANGDMRKVLNVLQSTWLAYKDVTEENVYNCVGHPLKSDIENIVKWLLNESFAMTYKNIKELKVLKGIALIDILTEVHKFVMRIEFPFEIMISLLTKMADIEQRLAAGASENLQLTSLVAAFHHAKQVNPPETT